jgi:hypothetical protein
MSNWERWFFDWLHSRKYIQYLCIKIGISWMATYAIIKFLSFECFLILYHRNIRIRKNKVKNFFLMIRIYEWLISFLYSQEKYVIINMSRILFDIVWIYMSIYISKDVISINNVWRMNIYKRKKRIWILFTWWYQRIIKRNYLL